MGGYFSIAVAAALPGSLVRIFYHSDKKFQHDEANCY